MEIEKEKISNLVEKLADKVDDLDSNSKERDEFIETIIDTVEKDLTRSEKISLYKYIFEELSFKRMVEQPDFMIKQSNVRLRGIFFSGILILVVIIVTGLLFSESPIIMRIHEQIANIFDITNLE